MDNDSVTLQATACPDLLDPTAEQRVLFSGTCSRRSSSPVVAVMGVRTVEKKMNLASDQLVGGSFIVAIDSGL